MVKGARATIAVSINHIWSIDSIAENPPQVNTPDENSSKEIRSKARVVDVNSNELSEAQQEYFKDSASRILKIF